MGDCSPGASSDTSCVGSPAMCAEDCKATASPGNARVLRESSLNFVGNVEGRTCLRKVDVIVTGFTVNGRKSVEPRGGASPGCA